MLNQSELYSRIKNIEPQEKYYKTHKEYISAKHIWDECYLIICKHLCSNCEESKHCEWFCDGNSFVEKEVKN